MAIQSIPRSGGAAGVGSLIGGGIGSALSEGIQALAESKLNAMQEQKEARDLRNAFPSLSHEEAFFLSKQPPKERTALLQQYSSGISGLNQQQQQQQSEQTQGLQALLGQQQKSQFPYRPEFTGTKQPEYGGREQQELSQQIQQAQQQIGAVKKQKPSLAQSLAAPASASSNLTPAQQLSVDKSNKSFLDKMTQYVTSAKKRGDLAREALELVRAGNVTSGATGLIPEKLLTAFNESDARFVTLVGELANEKALELRGPVGKAKIEAAQRTKAGLNLPRKAQEEILKREIKSANEAQSLEMAYEQIMEENNNIQPRDLETKVRKRAKEIEKELPSVKEELPTKTSSKKFQGLPSAREFAGKKIKSKDGRILKSNGVEWVEEK